LVNKFQRNAPIKAGGVLAALVPQSLDEAFRLSQALAGSGDMIPKAFQNNERAVMAAIVRGMEVGLAPMQALASIAVINGRVVIWGDAIPALVLRAGHSIDVDYEGEGDKLTAVATLTRGDTGKKIVRTFSIADAKRAGLAGKAGPWTQYPQRMIAMRARTWAVRDGAADALMGLGVAEEHQDYGPDAARDVTPADQPRRRGGSITYVTDPAPVVDEIYAATATDPELHGAIEAEHASQFQGVLDSIRVRIADGMEPAELRELFAAEIDASKVSAPQIYARIETALRGALL
jgi:hypothetical protein